MPRLLHRALFAAATLALAACAPREPSVPAPAAPPIEMSARERAARQVHVDPAAAADLISRYRQDHGLSAVTPDPVLQRLAQAQADAMAANNLLSHTVAGDLTRVSMRCISRSKPPSKMSRPAIFPWPMSWTAGASRQDITPICSRQPCGTSALRRPMCPVRAI